MEPLVNTFIAEAKKKIIFKFKKDYISMLLDIPEAYVYGEKFYDQSYLMT